MRPSCLIRQEGTEPRAQVEGRTLGSGKDGHPFEPGMAQAVQVSQLVRRQGR